MPCQNLFVGKNVKQHKNIFRLKDLSMNDKFKMIFRNLYSVSDKVVIFHVK